MRGRKPVPTELKILTGNPGKRPLNDQEPRPRRLIPTCPPHLNKEARKEWRRISKELNTLGLISLLDRSALAGYCVAWARWVKAEGVLASTGEVLKSAEGGLYQNPYLAVANRALEQVKSFLADFGMTPSSRCRLKVPSADKEKDQLETFMEDAG